MKRILIVFFLVLFITLFLPLTIVYFAGATPSAELPESGAVKVFLADEDKTVEMDINKYLQGVVAAEMPDDFEAEALKAQAVAARTYLYSHINGAPDEKHPDAPVCTDYTHCQAYTDKDIPDNIRAAVADTDSLIMTYNGQPISALVHSTSSGVTEAAADVWGGDVPYLKSVRSEGDINSPEYLSSRTLSVDDFKAIAERNLEGVDWSKPLFGNIERSEAGGIISLEIGGVKMRGTDFRKMLDLHSTNAEPVEKDGKIIISVRGNGHGVGMSQYGANAMAKEGKKYDEILKSYYTGIEIEKK
ncbi:MAG: stage II sporulation protein D [Clostridia bacterium]|nr:stage II sporulation protein D [Clostridia bacterium]